ncbi:MAG: hypothetical protein HY063_11085 [Bacteroidetes bacterium]|nr:hypothetical protein [Bacteroidota bacterium]
MKTKLFIPLILLAAAFTMVISCKKKKQEAPTVPLSYTSLKAQKDTIFVGNSIQITATATGDNITYSWALTTNPQGGSSMGDIIGGGATITYGTSPCCSGWNTITCKVSDGASSQSKSVTIVVKEP